MPYRIIKEHVWAGAIPDHPDSLAGKLRALAKGGLNLELIIARREWTGRGVLFASPLRTLDEVDVAEQAGLNKPESVLALRIEGPNVPGLAARITTAIAEAGLNVRSFAAAALGERSVTSVAFDSDADCDRAKAVLERTLRD
jgi:hypothetical protein